MDPFTLCDQCRERGRTHLDALDARYGWRARRRLAVAESQRLRDEARREVMQAARRQAAADAAYPSTGPEQP